MTPDQYPNFMRAALMEANQAFELGEVPVGAVVVRDNTIIARAGNRRQEHADPSGHAEILAMRSAGALLSDWRLEDCTLYVTLEPCPMCTAAARQARLQMLVWGASDPRAGACGSVFDLAGDTRLGRPLTHRGGLEADACGDLLRTFFAKQRQSS